MNLTKTLCLGATLFFSVNQFSFATAPLNQAENLFLTASSHPIQYQNEHIPIIEVPNTLELGKLAALSFLDWVEKNPNGVIALPSGKTPEYFIKFLNYYKENWHKKPVREELRNYGIHSERFPDTSQLRFVQLDEFYGIPSTHQRSFSQYVKQFYVKTLDLKPENILLVDVNQRGVLAHHDFEDIFPNGSVDLSLLERRPNNQQEKLQKKALKEAVAYCHAYEKKIRRWGGIGFFLGGIGLDGHIAFNLPGVERKAGTHLAKLNYQTSAQSAVDLGGIEHARDRGVITIGLGTLSYKQDAKIIIMAAGEAKAKVIAQAVEGPATNEIPASLLQHFDDVTFYITKGAAKHLSARKTEMLKAHPEAFAAKTVIDTALSHHKRITELTENDFRQDMAGRALLETTPSLSNLLNSVEAKLKDNIEAGVKLTQNKSILHTAPHHDDVMLSYYPLMSKLLHDNKNHFAYLTSGFNSVTDEYVISAISKLETYDKSKVEQDVIKTSYPDLLRKFSKAFEQNDEETLAYLEPIFVAHKIREAFWLKNQSALAKKSQQIKDLLIKKNPGDKDVAPMQLIKGMIRESEADRLWAINHVDPHAIQHLRSKFYTGAVFDPIPNIRDDARPVMKLYERYKPDIITVALDPEGTGPDTHYKVLQVVSQALKLSPNLEPEIWGYRNVWFRFDYDDANLFVPIQYKQLWQQNASFLSAFATQKSAAFPAPNYDGPFSELSAQIQQNQLEDLKTLLGEEYFTQHPSPLVRHASGFVLLKRMPKQEFVVYADDLKSKMQLDATMLG